MRRPWPALVVLGVLAVDCRPDMARYDAAVARMNALDARVDAGFDAVRVRNDRLLGPGAWDDPEALVAALEASRADMAEVLSDHRRRIEAEREILDLEVLAETPGTRLLYHMDLKAQEAKRDVLARTLEMYDRLLEAARRGDRRAYARHAAAYGARIEAANDRFRELDRARQRRQGGG